MSSGARFRFGLIAALLLIFTISTAGCGGNPPYSRLDANSARQADTAGDLPIYDIRVHGDPPIYDFVGIDDDDDDNDDDNNDDDTGQEVRSLFLFGQSAFSMTSHLQSGSGWIDYPMPAPVKGGKQYVVLSTFMPLFIVDGARAFASINVLGFPTPPIFHNIWTYELEFEPTGGWTCDFSFRPWRYALHAADEQTWLALEFGGTSQSKSYWVTDSVGGSMRFPEYLPLLEVFLAEDGEAMVSGYDLTHETGWYMRMQAGVWTAYAMPAVAAQYAFTSIWLTDAMNGWAVASAPIQAPIVWGAGELYRFTGGEWIYVPPPEGCVNDRPKRVAFADEGFGIAVGWGRYYWLYENGQWNCEELPFTPGQGAMPAMHVVRPGLFYVGDTAAGSAVLYQYEDGTWSQVALPATMQTLVAVGSMGPGSPRYAPLARPNLNHWLPVK